MAISLNGKKIDLSKKFPDGTFAFRVPDPGALGVSFVDWKYESDEELLALYYLVRHLRRAEVSHRILLTMYYVPNARMDRIKADDEVFTLKYFADFINALHFDSVYILDPHSSVTPALLNNCLSLPAYPFIDRALSELRSDNLVLFYPDEGAMKRYSERFKIPHGFGVKRRDWRTGKIEGLKIEGSADFKNKDVLIIDDICCRGGTFYHSARALKEAGAGRIYLFCTHCEHAIFDGELLTSDIIDGIFTTDSIFQDSHQKITVLPCHEILIRPDF